MSGSNTKADTGRTLKSLFKSHTSGTQSHNSDETGSNGSFSDKSASNMNRLSEFKGNWSLFEQWSALRLMCYDLIESKTFGAFILSVIFVNTGLIAIHTDKAIEVDMGFYITFLDSTFLGIYVFELILKFYVWRRAFFGSGWNQFDLFIVVTSVFDVLWTIILGSFGGFDPKILRLLRIFRTVRAFRALRVLRTIKFFQSLQVIVSTLLKSIPAWGNISLLLVLILYIYAIIGVSLYSKAAPTYFGNLWLASFTLFSLWTMDNWSDIYESVLPNVPHITMYLVSFIVIETFIFLQLFVAVIVNNLQELQRINKEKLMAYLKKTNRRMHPRTGGSNSGRSSSALEDVSPEVSQSNWQTSILEKENLLNDVDAQGRSVEHYYDALVTTARKRQLMGYTLMLMATLENHMDGYEHQQRTLDDLVDIAK